MITLSSEEAALIESRRVAHLATADAGGRPHVIPVCFAFVDGSFWIAVDEKPKRTLQLKRLGNIAENPRVALIFDCYDEDWSRLAYVLVHGSAEVRDTGAGHPGVLSALRVRYPQYRSMQLEGRPLIHITPERVLSWGNLTPGSN